MRVIGCLGDCRGGEDGPDGLYRDDTRFLSRLELRLGGLEPLLLGSVLLDDNGALIVDLANADIHDAEGTLRLQRDCIHVERLKFLRDNNCYERIRLRRFTPVPEPVPLEIGFDADFADLFEVKAGLKEITHAQPAQRHTDNLIIASEGLPITARIGATSRRMIVKKMRACPAPSIFAASSIEAGIVLKNPYMR